jgi:hypothetical protein
MALWTGYRSIAKDNTLKRGQTSIPQVGFEPTAPVIERSKTVRVSDSAVTVIGPVRFISVKDIQTGAGLSRLNSHLYFLFL